jgi:hypothetical protein
MGSHHADRRQFLTESAALASLAVGAVQSVEAQAPPPEARLKDHLAYGQPSRFDTTVRRALSAGSAIADTARRYEAIKSELTDEDAGPLTRNVWMLETRSAR